MMKKFLTVGLLFASALIPLSFAFANSESQTINSKSNITKIITTDSIKTDTIVKEKVTPPHPLEPLLKAIISVESKGNPKAYNSNGDCVGLLQITKVCVRECNNILKSQKSKKRYTYADRWDAQKSIEMFYIIQEAHNPTYNLNKGIRLWNKSASYKVKIMKALKHQK